VDGKRPLPAWTTIMAQSGHDVYPPGGWSPWRLRWVWTVRSFSSSAGGCAHQPASS